MVLTVSYQTAVHSCLEAQILYLPDIKTLTQKKVFLQISQNSQENTCARIFF